MSILLSSSHLLSSRTPTLILKLHNHNTSEANPSFRLLHSTGLSNKNFKNKDSHVALSVNANLSTTHTTNPRKRHKKQPLLSEGRDDDDNLGLVCPGCGVFMQDDDPTLPGYYQKKKVDVTDAFEEGLVLGDSDEEEEEEELEDEDDDDLEIEDELDWDSDWEPDFAADELVVAEEDEIDGEESAAFHLIFCQIPILPPITGNNGLCNR